MGAEALFMQLCMAAVLSVRWEHKTATYNNRTKRNIAWKRKIDIYTDNNDSIALSDENGTLRHMYHSDITDITHTKIAL